MDIPPTQTTSATIHSPWQLEELEKLRLSDRIHVTVIDDLKRVNLACQTDLHYKGLELQLYYKHINRLVHILNSTNFVLTSAQRELVESKHVNNEFQKLMEEYKRRCEMLTEQLKVSENQKAEQEQVMRTMYEVMEKARRFIDGPPPKGEGSTATEALIQAVPKRSSYDANPGDFNPKGGPISATRGGQKINSAFDRFVHGQQTGMSAEPFPVPPLATKHGMPAKFGSRPEIKGGPISASRGGQDVNSAFGRFMQQLGQSEKPTAAPSHTSTSGTARLNPASAPFTPPAAASQRQLQDILPPAQPIFVRPAKKPVTVAPPLPHAPNASKIPQVEGQQTATKLGPSVTGVDASQSQSTSRHEPSDTNNKVSDGPGVKGTPAPVSSVIEPRPQQAQNATASLRAWFDQLVKKEQATPSAKQISADSDELITFSDPNSPERVAGATQGDVANEQTKPDTLHQAPIPSGRDIFSQMPPAVRAAIQRVQRKASSTMGVKTHLPQEKPMTSPSLTSAQKEDKAMADAFGKLQAHWAKARWPKSPKGKENVRLAHVPAMPGSGEAAEVPANDDPTPKAFQEIREPAPLVPYASSEDSFDTRDSSNVSSSDHNSHGIGGSHVLGQYLAPDVKAMVLRGRKTNIQSPTDPLTAAQLKHMEVDRMGNKWQKIDRIGAGGRQKFGWVISNFYDPTTSDPHSKA